MIPTTNLLASQVPPPIVPSGWYRQYASGQSLPVGMTSVYTPQIDGNPYLAVYGNQVYTDLVTMSNWAGTGFCVVQGLTFNGSNGLTVLVSPGKAVGNGPIDLPNGGATGPVPDNTSLVFIWVKSDQTIGWSTSRTVPPVNASAYLFAVTTFSGAVIAVDNAGTPYNAGGVLRRTTGDLCAPTDSPPSAISIETVTSHGNLFKWNGAAHVPIGTPVVPITSAVDLTLSAADKGIYIVTPQGTNIAVKLPQTPNIADTLNVINGAPSGGYNVTVKDYSGAVVMAVLGGGYQTQPVRPTLNNAGQVVYSTHAIVPLPPI